MFEKLVRRIEAKDNTQTKTALPVTQSSVIDSKNLKKKTKARSLSQTERLLKLTAEQKCDIASREIEELKAEKHRRTEEHERSSDNYKAAFAEADLRLSELKKRTYEFDREVVKGAVDPRTGYIVGEKVVRYFEDQLKSMDLLVEKLRLKNASLKNKKRKLQMQLKQKEEAGEVRHEVDYEQLKIENKQFNDKCGEKNQELLNLKLKAGKTLQVLNMHKKELQTLCLESTSLDNEIAQRKEMLAKIDAEALVVEKETKRAEASNKEARQLLEDYKVPDVMEYVQEKASLYELKKAVKIWERKVEIAEMGLRTHKQTWKKLCKQSKEAVTAAWTVQEPSLTEALM